MTLQQKHYVFTLSNRDLACTAFLNGVPFFTDNVRNRMDSTLHLNPYIIPGINQFELVLTVPPEVMKLPDDPILISGKIECLEGNQESHTVTELVKINWNYEAILDFPINLKFQFDAGLAYGKRIWENADIVTEANLDRPGLFQFVSTVRHALLSKNFIELDPFLSSKRTELSKAFGFSEEELQGDDKRTFEEMFADPDWGITTFEERTVVIDYWADNRILFLQRPNGNELLRTPRLGLLDIFYSLPLILSRIDGSWQIIA